MLLCTGFLRLKETGGAAEKQGLISQQNMICARCRPVISSLPLLIYFLTSKVLLLQPEQNPREEGRGARAGDGKGGRIECSHTALNFVELL